MKDGGWIIVVKEKHGTRYFAADSTEQIGLVAVQLVKERYNMGYFEAPSDPPVEPTRKPEDFPDDEDLRIVVEKQWREYQSDKKQHLENVETARAVVAALNGNYIAAYLLLKDRHDYEYEGFEIEELEELEEVETALV